MTSQVTGLDEWADVIRRHPVTGRLSVADVYLKAGMRTPALDLYLEALVHADGVTKVRVASLYANLLTLEGRLEDAKAIFERVAEVTEGDGLPMCVPVTGLAGFVRSHGRSEELGAGRPPHRLGLPSYWPASTGRTVPAPSPPPVHHLVERVWVTAGSALLMCEDGTAGAVAGLDDDAAASYAHMDAGLVGVFGDVAVRRSATSSLRLDEAVLLDGPATRNWYHWLVDSLGAVHWIEVADIAPDVPLLVHEDVAASSNHVAALRRLTDRPLVAADGGTRTMVDRLHVVQGRIRVPFDLLPGVDLIPDGYALPPDELARHATALGAPSRAATSGRHVFISRRDATVSRLANADEVEDVAVARGFEVVRPADLTFEEQGELFATASVVLGPTGAAFANLLLAPPGVLAIGLQVVVPGRRFDFPAFTALAAARRQRLVHVPGLPSRVDADRFWNSPVEIDLPLLGAALDDLLGG